MSKDSKNPHQFNEDHLIRESEFNFNKARFLTDSEYAQQANDHIHVVLNNYAIEKMGHFVLGALISIEACHDMGMEDKAILSHLIAEFEAFLNNNTQTEKALKNFKEEMAKKNENLMDEGK